MIVFSVLAVFVLGVAAGAWIGVGWTVRHTREGRQQAVYITAINLCEDLVMNPDGSTLRPRAQKILNAHRTIHNRE